MCARYVLFPEGDVMVIPSTELKHLPKGSVILNQKGTKKFKDRLTKVFNVNKWEDKPISSLHVCPTNYGIAITLDDKGKRVAHNFRFCFLRKWGAGHNFRFDNLLPEKDDFQNQDLPTYKTKNPKAQWMNKRGNPQFYPAFKKNQFCLIPIKGFIEFDTVEETVTIEKKLKTKTKTIVKKIKKKIPYLTELVSGQYLCAAGLYEQGENLKTGDKEMRFTFGTTEPNSLVEMFGHDRFPVFLSSKESENIWLDPKVSVKEKFDLLKKVPPVEIFHSVQLNGKINTSTNKGLDVLEPAGKWFTAKVA